MAVRLFGSDGYIERLVLEHFESHARGCLRASLENINNRTRRMAI